MSNGAALQQTMEGSQVAGLRQLASDHCIYKMVADDHQP